jgi:hypothetical protein
MALLPARVGVALVTGGGANRSGRRRSSGRTRSHLLLSNKPLQLAAARLRDLGRRGPRPW